LADKLTKEALALHRQGLKAQLWKERSEGLKGPRCPDCERTICRPDDCVMHEVFIKRGNLPIKMQIRIMHKYNCALAHDWPCHYRWGNTGTFKNRCANQLFRLYGRDAIVAWVESLGLKQHVEIPLESEE